MKKRVSGKKLGRSRTARDALYRSLTAALAEHGKINTTHAKAKAVQPTIENLCSISKRGDASSKRAVLAKLANDKITAERIIKQVKLSKRDSGFTKITPLSPRRGDNVKTARLEWVDQKVETKKKKKVEKKK